MFLDWHSFTVFLGEVVQIRIELLIDLTNKNKFVSFYFIAILTAIPSIPAGLKQGDTSVQSTMQAFSGVTWSVEKLGLRIESDIII